MKPYLLLAICLISLTLLSHTTHASAWCKRPNIDHHLGSCYANNIAIIQHKTTKKYGFANKNQQIIIATQYDQVDDFSQGLSAVKLGDYWGMIDKNNQVMMPFEYEALNSPDKFGFIRAKKNGQWGLIDKDQNTLLAFGKYDDIETFGFDDISWVRQNDKWGFMDSQLNEIAPPQYDNYNHFTHPIVCIKKQGKSGCINKQGVEVIPFIYDKIDAFIVGKHQRKVVAYLQGRAFYFDKKGRPLS